MTDLIDQLAKPEFRIKKIFKDKVVGLFVLPDEGDGGLPFYVPAQVRPNDLGVKEFDVNCDQKELAEIVLKVITNE